VPLNNEAQAAWAVASKGQGMARVRVAVASTGQGLDPVRVARAENNLRHVTEFWEPLHTLILSVTVPQLQTLWHFNYLIHTF